MKILFLGQDHTYDSLIEELALNYDITVLGYENIFENVNNLKRVELNVSVYDVIVLPSIGLNEHKRFPSNKNNGFMIPNNMFCYTKPDCQIFGGIISKKIDEMLIFAGKNAITIPPTNARLYCNTLKILLKRHAEIINNYRENSSIYNYTYVKK